jgi:hypothetical protein
MLCLELGKLGRYERTGNPKGEAAIMLEWDWRVERRRAIAFGTSSSDGRMDRGIASLQNRMVEALTLEGRLPELLAHLSGGLLLRSLAAVEGQPQWSLFVSRSTWLTVRRGHIYRERTSGHSAQPNHDGGLRKRAFE